MSFRCLRNVSKVANYHVLNLNLPCFYFQKYPPLYTSSACKDVRLITTHTRNVDMSQGLFKKFVWKVKKAFHKHKLKAGGYLLYETVADQVDYLTFMKELRMPDTFHSWFMVTELHVWMLMVRIMSDVTHGRFVRNFLVEALWKDVDTRAAKLGVQHASTARRQVKQLGEEFQAALVGYDEGLGSDIALAGAVWRRLLGRHPDARPEHLEAVVKYIRQSIHKLDSMDFDSLVIGRRISWTPTEKIFKKS